MPKKPFPEDRHEKTGNSTHFLNHDYPKNTDDDREGLGNSGEMMTKPLMQIACELTKLSVNRLAYASGIPQSTLDRLHDGTGSPRLEHVRRITAVLSKMYGGTPDYGPVMAAWHDAICQDSGLDHPQATPAPAVDLELLEMCVAEARHSLRTIWNSVPPDQVAKVIAGAYHEVATLQPPGFAKRDA